MMQKVFRKTGPLLFTILVVGGCSLSPVRQDVSPQAPDQTNLRSSASYHYALGVLHALNENLEEAIREMEEARRLDPSSPYLAKEVGSLYTERVRRKRPWQSVTKHWRRIRTTSIRVSFLGAFT